MIIKILCIIVVLTALAFWCFHFIVTPTPTDRERDDEEQMSFIRKIVSEKEQSDNDSGTKISEGRAKSL